MAGFNRDVWEGRKPLVERPPTPIVVGSVVWERAPEDAQHATRGGLVLQAKVDEETGERVLTILRDGERRHGKFSVRVFDVPADEIDGALVEQPTSHRLHRASREICRALGEQPMVPVVGFDRYLLEAALGLADLASQVVADTAERLRANAS